MQMVSTEASPAPELSFAYMLAGVCGMLCAAALLVWQPEALLTRWHPAALAAVHVFALGGLMPVMLGALLQFVPVACGLSLPRWGWGDSLLLAVLMLGVAALTEAFLSGNTTLFVLAGVLLLTCLAAAGLRLAYALWRQPTRAELVASMRRSTVALGMTLTLACVLLGILTQGWDLPLIVLVDWHALWGMAGWVGGLVASVAGVVVPMFHVTDAYPRNWTRTMQIASLLLLAVGMAAWWQMEGVVTGIRVLLCAVLAGFGVLTALRVRKSRRGEHDAFYWGWLGLAAISLIAAGLALAATLLADPRWGVAFGIMMLAGFGGGAVNVMLYRIVPFLSWLHWQRHNAARARLPLLHQIIPEKWQRVQLAGDALGIALLTTASFTPDLTRPAALLLVTSKLMLAVLLAQAVRSYRSRLALLKTLPPRVRT